MIEYTNPDTNKKITLDLIDEKKIILLYGKNGVGKTTFSKSKDFDSRYVFNLDFIHKNVYVIEETGAKTSSSNKNSFSDMFIGEKTVTQHKYLSELAETKKECDEINKMKTREIVSVLGSEFQPIVKSHINKLEDSSYVYEPNIKISKVLETYKYPIVENTIKTEDEYVSKYQQYKRQGIIGLLVSKINASELLRLTILENDLSVLSKMNADMKKLNTKLGYRDELVEILESRDVVLRKLDKKWIKEGLKIHEERQNCIMCGNGNENVKEKIREWEKVLSNQFVSDKNKLYRFVENEIKNCNTILNEKEHYEKITPKLIENLVRLKVYLNEFKVNLSNDDFLIENTFTNESIEKLSSDINFAMNELTIYVINKVISIIFATKKHSENIDVETTRVKYEIEKFLDENSGRLALEINEIFKVMKLKKTFEIRIERRGGIKYKFLIDGEQINILSDGQRHKLALALFIKSVREIGLKDATLVIDDPVVSLDEETYHAIRDLIIKIRFDEDSTRIIILTHNIYYTYIQLSNIFDNSEIRKITSFYRMTSSEIKELDIDVLRTDDIVLFKKCIEEISTEEEVLILGGITNKIFRYFLDINLRYLGISSQMNPAEEIVLLNYNPSEIDELLAINRFIKRNSMLNRYPNTTTIIECFTKLKRAIEIFGVMEYIHDKHIKNMRLLSKDSNYSFDMTSSNIYFEIINSANKILYTDEFKGLKNYLAHPRQQITKQITSISNDIS